MLGLHGLGQLAHLGEGREIGVKGLEVLVPRGHGDLLVDGVELLLIAAVQQHRAPASAAIIATALPRPSVAPVIRMVLFFRVMASSQHP